MDAIASFVFSKKVMGEKWRVLLEWTDPLNRLREKRPTQVDAVAWSNEHIIFFECKFTEPAPGTCSRPFLDGSGFSHCDGNYHPQHSPIRNSLFDFYGVPVPPVHCPLTAEGIRYWEIIPEVFALRADRSHSPCPFRDGFYQLMRNVVQCCAVARSGGLAPGFALAYADSPHFGMAGYLKRSWPTFAELISKQAIAVGALSFQKIIELAINSPAQDPKRWTSLDLWLRRKMNVAQSRLMLREKKVE